MEGGLDNAAREVDTERNNLEKAMEQRWKKETVSKIMFGNDD